MILSIPQFLGPFSNSIETVLRPDAITFLNLNRIIKLQCSNHWVINLIIIFLWDNVTSQRRYLANGSIIMLCATTVIYSIPMSRHRAIPVKLGH